MAHFRRGNGDLIRGACLLCLLFLTALSIQARPLADSSTTTPQPLLPQGAPVLAPSINVAGLDGLQELRYPANISGTFKGTWEMLSSNASVLPLPLLKQPRGSIVFQLATIPTAMPDMAYVMGEVVLRDGIYITDEDVHIRMEGVYMRSTGQLRVVMKSTSGSELSHADAGTEEAEAKQADSPGGSGIVSPDPASGRLLGRVPPQHQLRTSHGHDNRCKIFRMTMLIEPRGERGAGGDAQEARRRELMQQGLLATHASSGGSAGANNGNQAAHLTNTLRGELESPDCQLSLRVDASALHLELYYSKAINYTLMVTFISFIQVLCIIRQIEYSNTQAAAAKVSLLMIGQQAIMDAYLCLIHLTAGIVIESLFNSFATASFFEFIIFSIFEMRFLLSIWKARRPANFDGWGATRRELSILYTRFYGCLLAGIVIMYQLSSALPLFVLALCGFWVPQIVFSATADVRKPLHSHYIIGMTITRMAIPCYLFGCPENFMRVKPNYPLCLLIVGFLILQAALLLLQHHFGPRCFIPKRFLPVKYDYYRRLDAAQLAEAEARATGGQAGGAAAPASGTGNANAANASSGGGHHIDCVICMAPVDVLHASRRMLTPCDHFFHSDCLQRWMDIKMECPTCRRALPAL